MKRTFFLPLLLFCGQLFAQNKTLPAIKIAQAPVIDGNLDDAVWKNAPVAKEFIQNFPSFGSKPSVPTEVRILYDNNALYIGAYLYDDPSLIRKQITSRDGEDRQDVDYFSVFLDTYNDNQNGFQFLVTSMNVQTDARLGPNLGGDFGEYGDKSWDAVWESEVNMSTDGWIVEMKIPYISLRFSKKEVQDWGLQFLRFTRRNNENSFWNAVDPNIGGFVNQFGHFIGLKNIEPALRLSFSPYVSTGLRRFPQINGYKTEWLRSGGMDVKYGINESFTLDATVIPDFGQVVSDNVVNNLTPFEIRFEENRPFFTEGTELFNKSGLFYSRRVGAIPPGYYFVRNLVNADPNLELVKNPSVTQLYNAIKFSGRTKKKLGIGVFNAVTAPMQAVVRNNSTQEKTKIETAPLTNYNLFVLDQALTGRSYLTLTNASTIRNGIYRDANVTAFDFSLFDNSNTYNFRGTARYSRIFGMDSYDGHSSNIRFSKVSGPVQYFASANIESDEYDPNDLGYLSSPNEVTFQSGASYNQFAPTKNFLTYNYFLNLYYNRLYKPNEYSMLQLRSGGFWVFKNFWDVSLSAAYVHTQHDYFVLDIPGRFVKRPLYVFGEVEGSTDSRKRLFFSYEVLLASFFKTSPEKNYHVLESGLRYRVSNKLTLEVENRHEGEKNYIVRADTTEMNGEPIIGFVDFKDVTSTLSGIYNFTPRLNLTMRLRHYWSRVVYNSFANVNNKGEPVARPFIPGQDENFNVFNLDAFLTWDFRLGSRLIAGYKNWLGEDEMVFINGKNNYLKNLGQTFDLRHGNEFTVKFIYFLDYNQLRKRNK